MLQECRQSHAATAALLGLSREAARLFERLRNPLARHRARRIALQADRLALRNGTTRDRRSEVERPLVADVIVVEPQRLKAGLQRAVGECSGKA